MQATTRAFLWGAVLAVAGTWAYHAFIHPLPRTTG
jgi:hypothetical protein